MEISNKEYEYCVEKLIPIYSGLITVDKERNCSGFIGIPPATAIKREKNG